VAQRMHAALAAPIAVAGRTFHVQASVGISAAGRPGMNTATLLQEADTAMYRAKKTCADTAVAARDWPCPTTTPTGTTSPDDAHDRRRAMEAPLQLTANAVQPRPVF